MTHTSRPFSHKEWLEQTCTNTNTGHTVGFDFDWLQYDDKKRFSIEITMFRKVGGRNYVGCTMTDNTHPDHQPQTKLLYIFKGGRVPA